MNMDKPSIRFLSRYVELVTRLETVLDVQLEAMRGLQETGRPDGSDGIARIDGLSEAITQLELAKQLYAIDPLKKYQPLLNAARVSGGISDDYLAPIKAVISRETNTTLNALKPLNDAVACTSIYWERVHSVPGDYGLSANQQRGFDRLEKHTSSQYFPTFKRLVLDFQRLQRDVNNPVQRGQPPL